MMPRLRTTVTVILVAIASLSAVGCNAEQVRTKAAEHGIVLTDAQVQAIVAHHTRPVLRPGLNWAALRKCESGGNYRITNPSGKYMGAYQFDQPTWNANAPAGWRGVRPHHAPPRVQDQAAQTLFDRRGRRPWPLCGKRL